MRTFLNVASKLLFTHQVARRLGVAEPTVRRWARLGILPAFKVGPRMWRVREEDLDGFLNGQGEEDSED